MPVGRHVHHRHSLHHTPMPCVISIWGSLDDVVLLVMQLTWRCCSLGCAVLLAMLFSWRCCSLDDASLQLSACTRRGACNNPSYRVLSIGELPMVSNGWSSIRLVCITRLRLRVVDHKLWSNKLWMEKVIGSHWVDEGRECSFINRSHSIDSNSKNIARGRAIHSIDSKGCNDLEMD